MRDKRTPKDVCEDARGLRASGSFIPLPLPRPFFSFFFFFCSRPNFLDELARKRLLRRLGKKGLSVGDNFNVNQNIGTRH